MTNHSQQIIQKLWNYCNVLRDDGLSYGDYVEQLTLLLFLKMAHERTQPPLRQGSVVPEGFDRPSLVRKDGDALETHYRHILEELGKKDGMLGIIFRKAQNKIQDPAKLKRLIADLIDRGEVRGRDSFREPAWAPASVLVSHCANRRIEPLSLSRPPNR
jgi:type I restriction enzyme M protein